MLGPRHRWTCLAGALLALGVEAGEALADDDGGRALGSVDGGAATDATVDAGLVPTSSVGRPREDTRLSALAALVAGSLEADIPPESLFDVPLNDEAAIQIEAARVRALLAAADAASRPAPAVRRRSKAPDAGSLRDELPRLDAARWGERLELDRARLTFYALPASRRGELLAAHAARVAELRRRETTEARRRREVEAERLRALEAARIEREQALEAARAEREQALEAARVARTEAERLVSEELARLIAIETQVANLREEQRGRQEQLAARRDALLGWQRRVRDAKAGAAEEADATYDALRRALRSARDDLDGALDDLQAGVSEVPTLGADPLVDLPLEVSTEAVRERRASVAKDLAAAEVEQRLAREARARWLIEEVTTLNQERLGLLDALSAEKRHAVTGLTLAGLDQAQSELRHLALVAREHQIAGTRWLGSLRRGEIRAIEHWRAAATLLPLLLVLLAFAWGRRRTPALVALLEERLEAIDRAERRTSPSVARRAARVLGGMRRALEWILLYEAVDSLLPAAITETLEVQLVSAVVGWSLAGALVVNTIHALAAENAAALSIRAEDEDGRLRLRSLQLVGRTVVVFALLLVLSARLVGEGTIYSWVFSTCWFAAIPVFLVLVRWWRGTVFARLDRARKKSPLEAWVLANRAGWKSFLAAMVGALDLFAAGAGRLARSWLSSFDLARKIHAYLFRREIERLGDGPSRGERAILAGPRLEALHPARPLDRWVSCPSDEILDDLRGRAGRGELVALVGARGMGKSAALDLLAREHPDATYVGATADTSVASLAERLQAAPGKRLVLVDDAHLLIGPWIGGLHAFDAIVAFARTCPGDASFVFAIDSAMWPLLERARDDRPIFDVVHALPSWTEVQLGELLDVKSASADIAPTWDDLLESLPPGADELDRQDALRATRVGYVRMLWDHVRGNPGLALEAWRTSLATTPGGEVRVRALQVPEAAVLEGLPDPSLFLLRAILQLSPAGLGAVAKAARLSEVEARQHVRFGEAHGFLAERDGRVEVTWPWLREVTRLLERRHLLVSR